ncbi:hypothetical protein [Bauldia sp.]|uniref:hypothetical protein n=1 Tax=Bauldia sp. TaxID=2575872 RepID=UPI003BABF937
MLWLNDILLFAHFVGMIMGTAPGIANMVISRQAVSASPDGAAALRTIPPILAGVSGIGLLVLWVTGAILIFTAWQGVENLPVLFWVKLAFVVILTIIAIMVHVTIREIRATGNVALSGRLRKLGPFAGVFALFAILFAVLAFNT